MRGNRVPCNPETVGWSLPVRRIWLVLLFTGLAVALTVPSTRVILVPAVAVLSAGLAVRGVLAWQPPARAAWWTVTAGVVLLAVGYAISLLDVRRWPDLQRIYPQWYDGLFVAASAVVIVGAIMLLRRIHPTPGSGDLIDALMVAVGLGALVVQWMFGPALATEQAMGLPPLMGVVFPLASVVLLTAVARVILTGALLNKTMWLLAATVMVAVLSDILRARQAAAGMLPYDSFSAAFSVVKMALFAAAVMTPDMADPRLYALARTTMRSRTRLMTVVALGYAGPAILTVLYLMDRPIDPRIPIVATALILGLAVLRIDGLLRRFEHRATHDPLTDVLDHATFLQEALALAAGGNPFTRTDRRRDSDGDWYLGVLDLDGFKALNDSHGHLVGDEVLVVAARRLRSALRGEDTVGRLGGDEFGLLFRDRDPEPVARRMIDNLSAPIAVGGVRIQVSASLGVSRLQVDHANPEAAVRMAMRRADDAMYSVKGTQESFAMDAL